MESWRLPLPSTRFGWILLCVFGLLISGIVGLRTAEISVDYKQFYSAALLAGSGKLYDWEAMQRLQTGLGEGAAPFYRLPVYAYALKPLVLAGYSYGRVIWLLLSLLAALAGAALWPYQDRGVAMAAVLWSAPLTIGLACGQDTVLFFLFAAIGARLISLGHPFLAGLALSLCAVKFHLAAGIVILCLARQMWVMALGGAAGCFGLLAASTLIEGWGWPAAWYSLIHSSVGIWKDHKMPNLRGLAYWAPGSAAVEVVLTVLVLTGTWIVCRKQPLSVALPTALAAGLLAGHQSHVYDAILVLPLLLWVCESDLPDWLRVWACTLLVPPAYVLLLRERVSLLGHLAVTGFVLVVFACLAMRCDRGTAVQRSSG